MLNNKRYIMTCQNVHVKGKYANILVSFVREIIIDVIFLDMNKKNFILIFPEKNISYL